MTTVSFKRRTIPFHFTRSKALSESEQSSKIQTLSSNERWTCLLLHLHLQMLARRLQLRQRPLARRVQPCRHPPRLPTSLKQWSMSSITTPPLPISSLSLPRPLPCHLRLFLVLYSFTKSPRKEKLLRILPRRTMSMYGISSFSTRTFTEIFNLAHDSCKTQSCTFPITINLRQRMISVKTLLLRSGLWPRKMTLPRRLPNNSVCLATSSSWRT